MASILIVYATGEGQTEKIATHIATALRDEGHDIDLRTVAVSADVSLTDYDAVLLGASIHMGKHQTSIHEFTAEHLDALESRPSGFFEVSLSAAGDDDQQATAAGYVEAFVEETGFKPDLIGIFGGALRYSRYGFFKRKVMQRIARTATGDTDTSRDYEYTNWEDVERFAADFSALLAATPGIAD